MNRQIVCVIGLAALLLVMSGAHAARCKARSSSSEDIAECLGYELRDADVGINDSYQALMGKLGDADKVKLRQEQRAWIKERDAVCRLDGKQTDREKWYESILTNYSKTVCVTRYTWQRTAALNYMLRTRGLPVPGEPQAVTVAPPPPVSHSLQDYQVVFPETKTTGLWYFEVTINVGEIARFSPTAMDIQCQDRAAAPTGASALVQARGSDTSLPILRKGFALDLESGKFYVRTDGAWLKGSPGSTNGLDLKLGRVYVCGIDSTALVAPLLKQGFLDVNLGERPFAYAMPDGYRPFSESGR